MKNNRISFRLSDEKYSQVKNWLKKQVLLLVASCVWL